MRQELETNRDLSLPLTEAPLAFVDVETTGLTAALGDRICEVAVVLVRGDRELFRFATLVNPLRPISPGAAAVNGLCDALLQDAPLFAEVAGEVRQALSLGLPVAHNAPFDLSFLAPELAAAGQEPPAAGAGDTLALARRLLPPGQRCGLPALAGFFRLSSPGEAHRALADALMTRALFWRLLGKARLGRRTTLADLLELQGGPAPWPTAGDRSRLSLPPELAGAVDAGRRVLLVYLSASGQRTSRLVELSSAYASGGTVYLVGFCHLRQEQRTFRLDRILDWTPA